MKELEKLWFLNIILSCNSKFTLKTKKIGIVEFSLLSCLAKLWGKYFRHGMCVGEWEPTYD